MRTNRVRRAVAGLLAAAVLALPACGGDPDDNNGGSAGDETPTGQATTPAPGGTAGPPGSPDGSENTPPQAEQIDVEIAGGQVVGGVDRASVDRDRLVRIVVTSDEPDEVHLHGYDLTAGIGPDGPGFLEFEADQVGLFELETHDSGLVLLQLQVQ